MHKHRRYYRVEILSSFLDNQVHKRVHGKTFCTWNNSTLQHLHGTWDKSKLSLWLTAWKQLHALQNAPVQMRLITPTPFLCSTTQAIFINSTFSVKVPTFPAYRDSWSRSVSMKFALWKPLELRVAMTCRYTLEAGNLSSIKSYSAGVYSSFLLMQGKEDHGRRVVHAPWAHWHWMILLSDLKLFFTPCSSAFAPVDDFTNWISFCTWKMFCDVIVHLQMTYQCAFCTSLSSLKF